MSHDEGELALIFLSYCFGKINNANPYFQAGKMLTKESLTGSASLELLYLIMASYTTSYNFNHLSHIICNSETQHDFGQVSLSPTKTGLFQAEMA